LESLAKAGYFPSPHTVVERVAALIRPARSVPGKVVRLLDPCCGTGAALRQLAGATGGETYGIEIEQDRAAEAQTALDRCLATNALAARIGHGAFSLLFLNPPYDYDEEDKRLEHTFLTAMTRALCPGGVLVFIVPQRRLAVSARYLAGHYMRLSCYRFPMPEDHDYHQVALLGVKREAAMNDSALRERIELWAATDALEELPEPDSREQAYDLPALSPRPILFASMFIDPLEVAREARTHGLWVNPALVERLWPAEERPVRPLMPLRRGHLAVLIAAGFLNNILLEADGQRLLVKGRTYKVAVPVDSEDPEVEIEREVLRTSIMALDLGSGRFETIQQGGIEAVREEERHAA
jgi:hypothetical protein